MNLPVPLFPVTLNTGLVSSEDASLPLDGHPSIDDVTINITYEV